MSGCFFIPITLNSMKCYGQRTVIQLLFGHTVLHPNYREIVQQTYSFLSYVTDDDVAVCMSAFLSLNVACMCE
jgi:hypothetical protein